MPKIVIAGGRHAMFQLNDDAIAALGSKGLRVSEFGRLQNDEELPRDHPDLVAVVDELGDRAGNLLIVTVPDDVDWYVHYEEGTEWVAERHRTWPKEVAEAYQSHGRG